ncbi:acyl-CoA dehydrogenase family protein [Bacteroidota bacterium]
MSASQDIQQLPYNEFLNNFKRTLKSVFYERDNIEKFIQRRGFPAIVLRDIMANKPLSVVIPKEYGGRGTNVREVLGLIDAAAYESLPLALTFGINVALFLEPVAKYAQDDVKKGIFDRFLNMQNMGGLMITEPDYGSDALNMQTSNVKVGSNYHIKGIKHWQGLTGMADYWLIASRQKFESGDLGRDLDYFICDVQQKGQRIIVEEYYNNMGLYPIPYGKNIIDIQVPEQFKLIPETTGLKLMMDLLHRSRFQFPAMGIGFVRRMMDEAIKHTNTRIVGGKPLIALDQVQHLISKIQSAFTICSAMCARSSGFSSIDNDLSGSGVEANSMKAYVSDLMQASAQTLTQLCGANAYKAESIGLRGIVDSRPFRIFEGSNHMLYTQISEMVLKTMITKKTMNFSKFLANFEITKKASEHFKSILNFTLDTKIPQRKMVDLGKIISRLVSANHVVELGENGFRQDLVSNSIENIKHEVSTLVSSFKFQTNITPIEEYKESGNWMDFC